MSGLHPQSKRKRDKRAVDMSRPVDNSEPAWVRPPPEECEAQDPFTIAPAGADPSQHRVKIRIDYHARSQAIIEFALVQQTYDRGRWRDVIEADSCHDVDAHFHRYARSTDARIGEPEVLMRIACEADVQDGYNMAYDLIEGSWSANYQRWHDA